MVVGVGLPKAVSSAASTFLPLSGVLIEGAVNTTAPWAHVAIRTGGVTDGLSPIASCMRSNHFQDAAVVSSPSVLTLVGVFLRSYVVRTTTKHTA